MTNDVFERSFPTAKTVGAENRKFVDNLVSQQVPNQFFSAELLATDWAVYSGHSLVFNPAVQTGFAEGVLAGRHLRIVENFLANGTAKIFGNL